jgi:tetratricopeptide (TPR) repeat protein
MRADLVALGTRLGWVVADEREEPALAVVRERLRDEGEGLLLIYDNAIDAASLSPYLPIGGAARVLVTSNDPKFRKLATALEIDVWPKEVGADFLLARTGRDQEHAAAAALSEALGGLPLAHEQAAAYCERLDVSLAEYAKRFAEAPARLLDTEKDAPAEYHNKLGLEQLKTASDLNNLANSLRQLHEFEDARPLFERALVIRENAHGPEHPDTATSLNLAALLRDQGDLDGARSLYERSLAIREKAPDLAPKTASPPIT